MSRICKPAWTRPESAHEIRRIGLMKKIRLAKVSTLLTGSLLFLSLTLPASAGTFSSTLTKITPQADVPVTSGYGNWTFTYTVKGRVSFLSMNIKNHAPGAADFCWHSGLRQPSGTNTVTTDPIPAAGVQACGRNWFDPDDQLWSVAYIDTADPKASVDVTVVYPDP